MRAEHVIPLVLLLEVFELVELEVEVEKQALELRAALVVGSTKLLEHRPIRVGAQGSAWHSAFGLAGHSDNEEDAAAAADTSIEHAVGEQESARPPPEHTRRADELLMEVAFAMLSLLTFLVLLSLGPFDTSVVPKLVRGDVLVSEVFEFDVSGTALVVLEDVLDVLLLVLVVEVVVVELLVLQVGVPRTRVLQSGEPLAFTHQQRPVARLH